MESSYELLATIGTGGMAEVFLARSQRDGRTVAVKRLLPQYRADSAFVDMFRDEVSVASKLNHPNIARVYGFMLHHPDALVMEFVHGVNLARVLHRLLDRDGKMPTVLAVWIALQVCKALAHAHKQRDARGLPLNIVHRDVTPSNILLSYNGDVKIIDFGIAKAETRLTRTSCGVTKGKLGYMSPEQALAHAIDGRSDLFAVGACLYEMLSVERLYGSSSDAKFLERMREGRITPLSVHRPDLQSAVVAVVERALARRREDRYASADEMAKALRDLLKGPLASGRAMLRAFVRDMFEEDYALSTRRLKDLDAGAWEPEPRKEERPTVPIVAQPDPDDATIIELDAPATGDFDVVESALLVPIDGDAEATPNEVCQDTRAARHKQSRPEVVAIAAAVAPSSDLPWWFHWAWPAFALIVAVLPAFLMAL